VQCHAVIVISGGVYGLRWLSKRAVNDNSAITWEDEIWPYYGNRASKYESRFNVKVIRLARIGVMEFIEVRYMVDLEKVRIVDLY